MDARFDAWPEICGARFIKERLKDPVQDARQECALDRGHAAQHENRDGSLMWDPNYQISIIEILNNQMEHVKVVLP